jgi:DNA invertase Pin-like site-specific DNA recombinase
MFRAGLYARVSTDDQQTIPLQVRALREYAARRGWTIALQVKEVGSGASQRQLRECVCQLDLAPFDALIWPHLVFG